MNMLIEYIVTNYIWFLVATIIILLAIIGNYADKTNFGQGNIEDNSDDNQNNKDSNTLQDNIINQSPQYLNQNIQKENDKVEKIKEEENHKLFGGIGDTFKENNLYNSNIENKPYVIDNRINNNTRNLEEIMDDVNISSTPNDNLVVNNDNANNEKESIDNEIIYPNANNENTGQNKINENVDLSVNDDTVVPQPNNEFEKKIDMLDQEFNEVLPEKKVINTDLLNEIEDLSLDRTQKINLSPIPELSDVELPEIKKMQLEEKDIWKF